MKKSILAILLFFCFTSIVLGQSAPQKFIPIWPDKAASFENSIKHNEELSKKGIDAELHIYTKGQHSFYALPYPPNRTTGYWNLRPYEWLRFMKFL